MSITASKYINNSDLNTSYIGLFQYNRPSRGKKDTEVNMYGLLSVASQVEIPGDKIAKFAWDGIVDGFEYSKVDSVNESLKLALFEATRRVKQLIANDTGIAQYGVDINFTIFVSDEGGIYIGLLGESDIFVYKKGRLVDIFDMLGNKKAMTAGVAVEDGDLIFSSTKGFLKENLKRIVSAKSKEELSSTLEELGKEVGDDQGLVILMKDIVKQEEVLPLPKVEQKVEVSSEPKDSDYIPTSVPQKRRVRSREDDKDLKFYISGLKQKILLVTSKIKKISSPLINIIKKFFKIVLALPRKIYLISKEKLSGVWGRKKWFKKISAKVSQSDVVRKRDTSFKEFRVDGYKQKGTRMHRFKILFFVILGISLVLGGIKFTLDQKEAREISKAANEVFAKVEEFVTSAQSSMATDRESTSTYILQASDELVKVPEGLSEKDTLKYEELKQQITDIRDTLYKIVRLSVSDGNIEKYYDTLNTEQNSKPTDIGIYKDSKGGEYLLITDTGLKSVYRISLYDGEKMDLPDSNGVLESPSWVYAKASGVFVLDSVNGIVKSSLTDDTFQPFVKLSGLSIQNLGTEDIAEFAVLTTNENTYVLDRVQKALLKSTNYGNAYSLSFAYVKNDAFETANDIFSDLSVYILTSGETGIHRYINSLSEGRLLESPIAVVGLDSPLKNVTCGYTGENTNMGLFVFDSEDKRLFRFEKPVEIGDIKHPNELHVLNQYIYPEGDNDWDDVKDFVVDTNEEYLYMLDGTTIWKVRL